MIKKYGKLNNKNELRSKYGFNSNDFVIGSFQRDTEGKDLTSPKLIKGPDIFLEIVTNISLKNPNIIVLLTGKRRNYLIKNFEERNINYKYLEMVDLKELNELYNVLDLYVVSSRIEGGPQAIMECAITETPVVSTDVGIASEILNQESIYKSIEQFHKAQPNTEFALQKAKSFTIPKGMESYIKMFEEVMKVSIGSKIVEGPWGGGNSFGQNMTEFLIDNGHQVIYDLSEPDIDLIL